MNVPMAATSRSRRSRRSSTPSCCGCWRSIQQRCRRRWIASAGPRRRRGWPIVSARGRAMNGARCWKAATPASPRCCRWMRRRTIRITSRATRSSNLMACRSPRRRRGSAARHLAAPTPPEPPGAVDLRARAGRLGRRRGRGRSGSRQRDSGLTFVAIADSGTATYLTLGLANHSQ